MDTVPQQNITTVVNMVFWPKITSGFSLPASRQFTRARLVCIITPIWWMHRKRWTLSWGEILTFRQLRKASLTFISPALSLVKAFVYLFLVLVHTITPLFISLNVHYILYRKRNVQVLRPHTVHCVTQTCINHDATAIQLNVLGVFLNSIWDRQHHLNCQWEQGRI